MLYELRRHARKYKADNGCKYATEKENEKKKMIAELIIPIETLRGKLRQDGYYFRMYNGKQIVQRCPNRKGHVKTEAEQANQERFVERYRKKKVGQQLSTIDNNC